MTKLHAGSLANSTSYHRLRGVFAMVGVFAQCGLASIRADSKPLAIHHHKISVPEQEIYRFTDKRYSLPYRVAWGHTIITVRSVGDHFCVGRPQVHCATRDYPASTLALARKYRSQVVQNVEFSKDYTNDNALGDALGYWANMRMIGRQATANKWLNTHLTRKWRERLQWNISSAKPRLDKIPSLVSSPQQKLYISPEVEQM